MWGRRKSSDEAAWQRAFKNRLEAVLGPDPSEPTGEANPSGNHGINENGAEAGLPVSVAITSSAGNGAGPSDENSPPADVHTHSGNGHIGQFPADTSSRRVQGEMFCAKSLGPTNGAQQDRPADGVVRSGGSELVDWRETCEKVLENESKLFQARLARIAEEAFGQARANAQGIVSRLESCLTQAEARKARIEASLTDLGAKSRETADAQTGALEAALAAFADRIEMLTGRVDEYRVQIEEMSSSLELTLANFSQKTQEAVQVQTRAFGHEMDRIAQQALGQAEDNIDDRTAKLREAAARSLEEQIAALMERVQNSQSQTAALLAKVQGSCLKYGAEVENAGRRIGELHQKEIESAVKTLKDRAAKEIDAQTAKVSQAIRDRVRNEVAAATSEFIEQEGRTRIQEAFHDSYEKCKRDLSSERQRALDHLQTNCQQSGAELIKQIQSRGEESLAKATTVLDDKPQTQLQSSVESVAARQRKRRPGIGGEARAEKYSAEESRGLGKNAGRHAWKLTPARERRILALIESGWTHPRVAERFGISLRSVERIIARKREEV